MEDRATSHPPFGQSYLARLLGLGLVQETIATHTAGAICAVPPLGADTTDSRHAIA